MARAIPDQPSRTGSIGDRHGRTVSSWIPLKPDIPSSRHPIEWLTKSRQQYCGWRRARARGEKGGDGRSLSRFWALARVVNRSATIEFINLLWGRANRKPVIAADFLGDPTGTRVGHANSRCSGEVETSNASNASDPLQEDRVALQTVVSAMVRKLVTIVGSGMGLGIDDHRRLFSPRGRSAVSIALVLDVVGNSQNHSPPRPKPSRREMMPSFFLAALNFLLSVIDWRSPSSRSALALTSRSATATAHRASH